MSNIYSTSNDPFLIELREWCKNNPLTNEDLRENLEFREFYQEESRKKALIRNSTMLICENCGKSNNIGNHKRWHGENCGKKTQHSKETKEKISNKLKGRIFSEEHRKNLSEGNRRRKGIKFKKKVPGHSSSSTSSCSVIYSAQNGQ